MNDSPLYRALALPSWLSTCSLLLQHGANVNIKNGNLGRSVLQQAVAFKKMEAAALFLKYGALVDDVSRDGKTALMIACDNEDIEAVQLLINAGASVDYCGGDSEGRSVLFTSLLSGKVAISYSLLQYGADINFMNSSTQTVLHVALEKKPHILPTLIQLGINVQLRTGSGQSALDIASKRGLCSALDLLLSAGCSLSSTNAIDGSTPLHSACSAGQIDTASFLLSRGAVVDGHRRDGYSALHIAAERCDLALMKVLLAAGANVATKTADDCNILHLIARNLDATELLLDELLQLQEIQDLLFQQNLLGHTPLHIACTHGNVRFVRRIYQAQYNAARSQEASMDSAMNRRNPTYSKSKNEN
jgi:ankyrin repeat protein